MCLERLGRISDAAELYRFAARKAPHRAEPARHLARMLQSEAWAQVADAIPCPTEGLFIERDKYK
jgi:hypothetical protein